MKKTLFAIIIPILFGAPLAYAATILLTQSSDSLNTGRTNTNTSLTNLNAALSNATSTEPSMAKYYVATSTLIASQFPYASTTAITASGSICIGSTCYSSIPLGANPTVSLGLSAVNGSASTFLRSDAAPALDQTIVPTMTGLWAFANTGTTTFSGGIESGTKIAAPYFIATSSSATSTLAGVINSTQANSTSTFSGGFAAKVFNATGASATSTFANGLNVSAGCFSVQGTCLGSGGSSIIGTTGQTVYMSGTNTAVGTSSVFIASNRNVGIGTTTPWGLLSIKTADTTATNYAFIVSDSSDNVLAKLNDAGLFTLNSASSTTLSAYTAYFGGSATTTIDTAGNVTLPSSATLTATKATITNASTTNFTVSSGPVNANIPLPFYMASSTWGTGTTTIEVLNNINNMTWKDARCHTSAGTLEMRLYTDTVNNIQYWSASTTRNTLTFSSNNVLSTATTTFLDIGNAASSPTSANCTFEYQYNGS